MGSLALEFLVPRQGTVRVPPNLKPQGPPSRCRLPMLVDGEGKMKIFVIRSPSHCSIKEWRGIYMALLRVPGAFLGDSIPHDKHEWAAIAAWEEKELRPLRDKDLGHPCPVHPII